MLVRTPQRRVHFSYDTEILHFHETVLTDISESAINVRF